MAIVTLRYWAAAKDAAGTAEETVTAGTLAGVLAAARGRPGQRPEPDPAGGRGGEQSPEPDPAGGRGGEQSPQLKAILARSSFLVDGVPVGRRAADTVLLRDGQVIEVLPPFAGG